jgi:hypothetical protein
MNPFEQLQKLFDSEINFRIETFWDAGFRWKLGDDVNGYVAEGEAKTLEDAAWSLAGAAREHFPESQFALTTGKRRRNLHAAEDAKEKLA